jgi:hypothetical protein
MDRNRDFLKKSIYGVVIAVMAWAILVAYICGENKGYRVVEELRARNEYLKKSNTLYLDSQKNRMPDITLDTTVDKTLKFKTVTPAYLMSFYNPSGKLVGYVDFKGDSIIFAGNVDKSADVFFNHCVKSLVDNYVREKLKSNFSPKKRENR